MLRSRKMGRVILHDTSSAFPPLAKGGRGDLGQSCAGQALQNPPQSPFCKGGRQSCSRLGRLTVLWAPLRRSPKKPSFAGGNLTFPFDQIMGNNIHGTPCAGVAAAAGQNGSAFGIASKCRILAVKIFHGDFLASDARVAHAIRYAALHADTLSCS